jgi:transmembrane sensor
VLEGRVQLAAIQLGAGQGVQLDAGGRVTQWFDVEQDEFAAWRQHRLWFEKSSLAQIAAEFNRYNHRKIVVVNDPTLQKKRFTGTWDPYDPDAFIRYLKGDPSVSIRVAEDWTVAGSP